MLNPVDGAIGTHADPVGEACRQETPLEMGFEDIAYGVVDNPVWKRRGADSPPFGLVDVEMLVAPRAVAAASKRILQRQ